MGGPLLISVVIKGGSLLFQIPPFKTRTSFEKFLTSMFSLGMSIGKKQNTLMKA